MTQEIDRPGLSKSLSVEIEGEVRFDEGSRALYSTDGSNYRQVPIGVVIPKTKEDVIKAVEICRRFGAPIVSRGGGTSLAGQCCNTAVVIDMSKYYNRILYLDPVGRKARVQPGIVLDDLRDKAEAHHLTFGPDPSTHNHCTIGGMIGNNSCGVHSVMAGKTVENVEELEILTYNGHQMTVGPTTPERLIQLCAKPTAEARIYSELKTLSEKYASLIREKYPKIPRRVSGYNLDELLPENNFNVARALVGSEGTCVVVLEATVRLVHSPPARSLLVLGYEDIYHAADHVTEVIQSGCIGLEAIDDVLVDNMKKKKLHPERIQLLPDGNGWLLVEFGGENKAESDAKAALLMARLKGVPGGPSMKLFDDRKEEEIIWKVRESGLGATARVPGEDDTWEGWEDSAVPPENLGKYLRELRKIYEKYGYKGAFYGHFGQGCLHTRINFDLLTAEGIKKFRSFIGESADLVVSLGGSISGEHGDGQSKAVLLGKMFGADLIRGFEQFKSIWDPDWKMNPGKVVRPFLPTQNLRLGNHYHPPVLKTHFAYPEEGGDFARATTRCVGVGECRRAKGGVMCPSYRATREEKHSTRGRAHLLFEMLEGDPLKKQWKSEAVKDALDLCLACKGCKSDCPVNVDMATYKAEFLSHYYKGKLRPANAYAMGLISVWSRIASPVAPLANFFTQTPGLSRIAKFAAGIAPEREIPAFARESFKKWFNGRSVVNSGKPDVILWPDTFNNFFHPENARAAVNVLEDAGYHVTVPQQHFCCGRPLYDFGMLDTAKRWLNKILVSLKNEIENGVPIVVLEPSCAAVFRDEMGGLFPFDKNAARMRKQVFTLSEFLVKVADYKPSKITKDALVQVHCHHHAVMKFDAEKEMLKRLGLNFQILDSGCCGMAGSFGFEKDHYRVSVNCAERGVCGEIRKCGADTLLLADGFSCREQILQLTGRPAMHVARAAEMALHEGKRERPAVSPPGPRPSRTSEILPEGPFPL